MRHNNIKSSYFKINSAAQKNLRNTIKKGEMREDFFCSIHTIPMNLHPLRERKGGSPLRVEHFLRIYSYESELRQLPGEVMKALMNYEYHGNVRELQNVIQRYLAVKSIDFLYEHDSITAGPTEEAAKTVTSEGMNLQDKFKILEKEMKSKAMLT